MAKRPPRPRAERRAAERAQQARVRTLDRVATLERGGTAEWPIVVDAAVVIERSVAAMTCHRCAGPLTVLDHEARVVAAGRRRVVTARCARCSAAKTIWFEIAPLIEADN